MRHYPLAHVVFVLALSNTASADEVPVHAECEQFSSIPGGAASPAAWNQVLSYAACIQDASVGRIVSEFQLPGFIEQLEVALIPSLMYYVAAVQNGPGPVKLRAAYQIGMSQLTLITRARMSIASPELRAELEPMLEAPAKLAWSAFAMVDHVATENPELVPDAVTQNMARAARQHAALLERVWSFEREEPEIRTAGKPWDRSP
jgi:hypothetical protein